MPSKVEGAERIARALEAVEKAARPEVERALHEGLRIVQRRAQALVPVRTGRLRRALGARNAIGRVTAKGLKFSFGLRTRALMKRAPYAAIVEFGRAPQVAGQPIVRDGKRTRTVAARTVGYQRPQPYLRPAFLSSRAEITRLVAEAIRRAVKGGG